jgi:YgiT-type zinc finger domain-containing protein
MGRRLQGKEKTMKCHACGGTLEELGTDLPFKIGNKTIVIIRSLPVMQCRSCSEYLIDDKVMEKVDALLKKVDGRVEVEIFNYAA